MDTVPIDVVLSMQQQGLQPNQIVQTLQNQGYDVNQIYEAINQASIKSGIQNIPPETFHPDEYPKEQNPIQAPPQQSQEQPIGAPQGPPQGFPGQMSAPTGMPEQMSSTGGSSMERIEEITEAIIDEKWKEMAKTMDKIIEWKDRVENRLTSMQQQMEDLKKNFDVLHQGVIGKIGDYDKNITDLGVEIKAMEKVFKEVLPTLTDNVNELSDLTKRFKTK